MTIPYNVFIVLSRIQLCNFLLLLQRKLSLTQQFDPEGAQLTRLKVFFILFYHFEFQRYLEQVWPYIIFFFFLFRKMSIIPPLQELIDLQYVNH